MAIPAYIDSHSAWRSVSQTLPPLTAAQTYDGYGLGENVSGFGWRAGQLTAGMSSVHGAEGTLQPAELDARRRRVRVTVALVCGSLALAVACAPGGSNGQSESSDAALAHVLSGYVVDFLRRNPTTNTYLGGVGLDPSLRDVDGTLRDHSAEALEQEDAWLRSVQRAIEAVDPEPLSPSTRIDREVALAQIRFMLRRHGIRRYQERALDTYVNEPFRALDWQIQGLTPIGEGTYGTVEEWTLVIGRLNAIPAFLSTAQEQLQAGVTSRRIPDWRMVQRDGLNRSEAHARYFADTLPRLAASRVAGPERERLLKDLGAAARQASDAYVTFRDFVVATYFDGPAPTYAADRFAMGLEEYAWATRNNFRDVNYAWTLYGLARERAERLSHLMISEAQQIAIQRRLVPPGHDFAAQPLDFRAVFDELSKDYPRSDAAMVSWYRDAADRLVEYGRRTGMFDVPADYRLEVVEAPPQLRDSIDDADYHPASPFKNTGIGRFYVTPARGDVAALRGNNRASLASLAAEGFPGHDWYFRVLTEAGDQISPVRWLTPGALEDSSSMRQNSISTEGWGLYAGWLMAEEQPGTPRFFTAEERLYLLQGQLYGAVRAMIDSGIHTGRLTYDEATTRFSEMVDFLPGSCAAYLGTAFRPAEGGGNEVKQASCERADRAVFSYSKRPTQALASWLGLEQIWGVRRQALTRLGDRFSLETFHRFFIRQGPIPSGYFQEALLRELEQMQPSAPNSQ